MTELVDAARALAWWTHANLSSPVLYRARRDSLDGMHPTSEPTGVVITDEAVA